MSALIFDMDGVVANTVPAHYRSWQRLADEEGVRFDEPRNALLLGRTRQDSLAIFAQGLSLDAATTAQWSWRKQAYFLDELAAMTPADTLPGVRELLQEAQALSLGTALASSSRNAHAVLARLELAGMFDVVADGATVAKPKPAPDIFLWTAQALGQRPQDCVVFEDSAAGAEAALAGGFRLCALGFEEPRAAWQRPSLDGVSVADFVERAGNT